jgi:hypothetical protein
MFDKLREAIVFFIEKNSPKREIKKREIILQVSDFEGFQSQEGKGEKFNKSLSDF